MQNKRQKNHKCLERPLQLENTELRRTCVSKLMLPGAERKRRNPLPLLERLLRIHVSVEYAVTFCLLFSEDCSMRMNSALEIKKKKNKTFQATSRHSAHKALLKERCLLCSHSWE